MRLRHILIIILLFLSSGCTSLPLKKARTDFYSGNLARADSVLGECKEIPKRNRLLCYMEKGVILHYMDAYEESTNALLNASRFVRDQDQISIKDQSTAVMINDMTATYKGEYSERLWIHTFLMMDFLLQHRYEDALVEGKQALEVYGEYPKALEEDHFTRALIALCFENMNQPDDARIEYEKLAKSMGVEHITPEPIPPGKGELILFIAQGRVPEKISVDVAVPPSIRISIPRYADSGPPVPVEIREDGSGISPYSITTDMGEVDRKSLNDRAAQYLTRQALRAGAKEAVARRIGENSDVGEALARVILFLLEEADTRSWGTLPGSLTLARIKMDAGIHDLDISAGYSGTVRLRGIDIPEGRRVYRSIRLR